MSRIFVTLYCVKGCNEIPDIVDFIERNEGSIFNRYLIEFRRVSSSKKVLLSGKGITGNICLKTDRGYISDLQKIKSFLCPQFSDGPREEISHDTIMDEEADATKGEDEQDKDVLDKERQENMRRFMSATKMQEESRIPSHGRQKGGRQSMTNNAPVKQNKVEADTFELDDFDQEQHMTDILKEGEF